MGEGGLPLLFLFLLTLGRSEGHWRGTGMHDESSAGYEVFL